MGALLREYPTLMQNIETIYGARLQGNYQDLYHGYLPVGERLRMNSYHTVRPPRAALYPSLVTYLVLIDLFPQMKMY